MTVFFTPEVLEVLKRNVSPSDETLHKIMNPMCGRCMLERGQRIIDQQKETNGDRTN